LSTKKSKKSSLILSLKKEGRINEDALNAISELTVEEIIGVKLELSARQTKGKLYNLPIWYTLPNICRDACMKFAFSYCSTKSDMASLLGIPYEYFIELYKKYNTD
jgi:hypothetical protein